MICRPECSERPASASHCWRQLACHARNGSSDEAARSSIARYADIALSQPWMSLVVPLNRPKNSFWIWRVSGPALPVPTWRPSAERIGVISAAVPNMKSSSHR